MQFDWPTPDQITYRIHRLRRLIALAIALPVLVLLGGSLIDTAFIAPDRATLAAMAVAVMVVGHVILFPNAGLETIAMSLGVTAMSVAAPWIKAVAVVAPLEYRTAALMMLIALSVVATGLLIAGLQVALGWLMMVGPMKAWRLRGAVNVPCSPDVARGQFALQPNVRRGRILTGQADENGFFDVAILAPQIADPEMPSKPMVVRVAAKVIDRVADGQQTMLVLPNGRVTVTSEQFTATTDGCHVEITELPGDFTIGMYAMFWLTDQQMDNLTETADLISGNLARANGLAHGVSFMSIIGAVLAPQPKVVGGAD